MGLIGGIDLLTQIAENRSYHWEAHVSALRAVATSRATRVIMKKLTGCLDDT